MQPTAPNLLEAIPTLEADIPAEALEGISPILWGSCIGGLLLLAAVGLWLLLRLRRTRRQQTAPDPLQSTLSELENMEQELPALRPCSLKLSLLLRGYLAGSAQDTALYETQEEFTQRMDALAGVPDTVRPETRTLLDELASYKYAGDTSTDSLLSQALITRTRDLIIRLDEARREQEATQRKGGEEE